MPEAKRRRVRPQEQEGESVQKEEGASIPLGKYLASTEKKIRDGAIKSLARYLAQSDREPLGQADMAKLWKGIFYCFWMSDKPRVQQALAQELADLLLTIKAPSSSTSSATKPALLFLEGFFDAMVREWPGLDKWRVDKFYLLFRRFVNAAFRLLASHGWETEGLSLFTGCLTKEGGPLCPNDIKVPDGITYHLADIYVEELDKAVANSEEEGEDEEIEGQEASLNLVPVLSLLQPFIDVMATCHSSLVYDRILNSVISPFLEDCLTKEQEEELASMAGNKRKAGAQGKAGKRAKRDAAASVSTEDDGSEGEEEEESACQFTSLMYRLAEPAKDMRKKTFEAIFQSASRSDSVEARRRRLYKLCKEEEERIEEEEDDQ